ncbi:MAG: hypothetical protein ACTSYA_07265 [Candidatus Kariarchaeaceae archaeon]
MPSAIDSIIIKCSVQDECPHAPRCQIKKIELGKLLQINTNIFLCQNGDLILCNKMISKNTRRDSRGQTYLGPVCGRVSCSRAPVLPLSTSRHFLLKFFTSMASIFRGISIEEEVVGRPFDKSREELLQSLQKALNQSEKQVSDYKKKITKYESQIKKAKTAVVSNGTTKTEETIVTTVAPSIKELDAEVLGIYQVSNEDPKTWEARYIKMGELREKEEYLTICSKGHVFIDKELSNSKECHLENCSGDTINFSTKSPLLARLVTGIIKGRKEDYKAETTPSKAIIGLLNESIETLDIFCEYLETSDTANEKISSELQELKEEASELRPLVKRTASLEKQMKSLQSDQEEYLTKIADQASNITQTSKKMEDLDYNNQELEAKLIQKDDAIILLNAELEESKKQKTKVQELLKQLGSI